MAKKSTDSNEVDELEEDLDEVELDDESKDETESENQDSDDNDDEETGDESDDSDDEDEDESDDEDSEGFKKRLTQFKGDTPEEYAKSIEDGYLESSKESVRLAKEVKDLKGIVDKINQVVATNPELAKALGEQGETAKPVEPKDPALAWAEAERDKQWAKDYKTFTEKHPEIETDPVLSDSLNTQLLVVKKVIEETEGRLVGMGEGLEKAWKLLGKDDSEEKLQMAVKDNASKGKAATGKNSESKGKVKFTDAQIQVTMDLMNLDRNEAVKQLSLYN